MVMEPAVAAPRARPAVAPVALAKRVAAAAAIATAAAIAGGGKEVVATAAAAAAAAAAAKTSVHKAAIAAAGGLAAAAAVALANRVAAAASVATAAAIAGKYSSLIRRPPSAPTVRTATAAPIVSAPTPAPTVWNEGDSTRRGRRGRGRRRRSGQDDGADGEGGRHGDDTEGLHGGGRAACARTGVGDGGWGEDTGKTPAVAVDGVDEELLEGTSWQVESCVGGCWLGTAHKPPRRAQFYSHRREPRG